jgi:hypothetical protein
MHDGTRLCINFCVDSVIYLVNSFVELSKYLLVHTGTKFILSERFNQDPLGSHFGKQ